jgi:hypothetical protein
VRFSSAQAEVVEARSAARDARRKLAATQQRMELMVGRSMRQEGPRGGAPASAPASPAQQRPPRQGDSAAYVRPASQCPEAYGMLARVYSQGSLAMCIGSMQTRGWMNGHSVLPPARQQRSLLQ